MKRLFVAAIVIAIVGASFVWNLYNNNNSEPTSSTPCPVNRPDIELRGDTASGSAVKIGAVAPDILICNKEGNVMRLSDFRGRYVFLNLWASWCPPCREEMPSMEKISQKYRDSISMLAVAVLDNEQDSRNFFEVEYAFSYSYFFDKYEDAVNVYGIASVPQTFLIASDGTISAIILGARLWTTPGCVDLLDAFASGQEVTRMLIRGC